MKTLLQIHPLYLLLKEEPTLGLAEFYGIIWEDRVCFIKKKTNFWTIYPLKKYREQF